MWGLLAALWFLALGNVAAAPAQPPDYSAGVKKLFELGLTDVRQAKYVRVESPCVGLDGWGLRERGLNVAGNAWLLEPKSDGGVVIVANQATVIELRPSQLAEQQMQARLENLSAWVPGDAPREDEIAEVWGIGEAASQRMVEQSWHQGGNWQAADLSADVRTLIQSLDEPVEENDDDGRLKCDAASLFLFAAHLYNRGLTVEANHIISRLIQRTGDSQKLAGIAIHRIAEAQYRKVYEEFEHNGNWAQYLSAMEAMLGRFGRTWRHAPVVEKVAGMVRQHLRQKSVPALTETGLTEEDVFIATSLGQSQTVINPHHAVFSGWWGWVDDAVVAGRPAPAKDLAGPLTLIQQRGHQAVPLLAALLKDEWLVRTRSTAPEPDLHPDWDEEPPGSEQSARHLDSIPRPWSRGEIARRILEPLGLDREAVRRGGTATGLGDLAQRSRSWYEQHQTATRAELRRERLAGGHPEPLNFLLNSPEPADRAVVESYLMNTNKLLNSLWVVTEYAEQQGAPVKPFVRKYLAEVNKLPSLLPKWAERNARRNASLLKQREERLRADIRTLEDMVSDQTVEQVLQQVVWTPTKLTTRQIHTLGRVLKAKLAQEEPGRALAVLLQACLKTSDDPLAEFLIHTASMLRWDRVREWWATGVPRLKPGAFTIETHGALWRQVMAQERRGTSRSDYWGGDALPFKVQVAVALERFYSHPKPWRDEADTVAAQFLGAKAHAVTVQRALARLAGKPVADLPGYPTKATIGTARVAHIGRLLRESTQETQHEIASQLSLDELLAVPDLVSADRRLNEKLVPASHRVQNVLMTLTNDALAQFCLRLRGKALDRKALEAIRDECRSLVAQGSNVTVVVERRLPLAGVTIHVRIDSHQDGLPGLGPGGPTAGDRVILDVLLESRGVGTSETLFDHDGWPIWLTPAAQAALRRTGPAKPADDDLLRNNARDGRANVPPRAEEEFWNSVERLFEPERNACQPYACTLSVQPADAVETIPEGIP